MSGGMGTGDGRVNFSSTNVCMRVSPVIRAYNCYVAYLPNDKQVFGELSYRGPRAFYPQTQRVLTQ